MSEKNTNIENGKKELSNTIVEIIKDSLLTKDELLLLDKVYETNKQSINSESKALMNKYIIDSLFEMLGNGIEVTNNDEFEKLKLLFNQYIPNLKWADYEIGDKSLKQKFSKGEKAILSIIPGQKLVMNPIFNDTINDNKASINFSEIEVILKLLDE